MKILSDFSLVSARLPAFVAASVAFCIGSAHAANISLTANGSFSSSTGWSNGAAPSAGNDYFSGNFNVATDYVAGGSASPVFGGNSLTIGSGTGLLVLRTQGTVTVNDLRLNSGGVQNWGDAASATTLAGNQITMTGYGQISPSQGRTINITAPISGTGQLRVKAGKVVLTGFNTYSGGTVVQTDATYPSWLEVDGADTLGSGDVTVQSGSKLTLKDTVPNTTRTTNTIADTASLILPTGIAANSVALSFAGYERINKLSLDGGATWVIAGTWGSMTSSATHKNAAFTGNGLLAVGANVVTNSLGDSFTYSWSDEFTSWNSARWERWPVRPPPYTPLNDGLSWVSGSLVMSPFIDGGNVQPRLELVDSMAARYGRFEAVIRTDTKPGVCNAFYIVKPGNSNQTLTNWQEIDILEIWNNGTSATPQQNFYWGSTKQYTSETISPVLADGWHTLTMDWTPNRVLFYINGTLVITRESDSNNNPVAKTMYAQVVHFSNWVVNAGQFTGTPPSVMQVDRFTYYTLDHDNRLASAHNGSSGVVVTGAKVSGLDAGTDYLQYNSVNTTKHRNITFDVACWNAGRSIEVYNATTNALLVTVPLPVTGAEPLADGSLDYQVFTQVSANLTSTDLGTIPVKLKFLGGTACGTLREIRFHGSQPCSQSRHTLIRAVNGGISTHPSNPSGPHGPALTNGDYASGLHGGPGSYTHFYLKYSNVNFLKNNGLPLTNIVLELGYGGTGTKTIYLHKVPAGGTPSVANRIGSVTVSNTGGYRSFSLLNTSSALTGIVAPYTEDLYLTFDSFDCGNLRSLRFPR